MLLFRLPHHILPQCPPRFNLFLKGHRSRLVTSIDWATCNGRKHHRIATCGGDGQLQVHRVTSPRKHGGSEWRDEESQQLYDGMKVSGSLVRSVRSLCSELVGFLSKGRHFPVRLGEERWNFHLVRGACALCCRRTQLWPNRDATICRSSCFSRPRAS